MNTVKNNKNNIHSNITYYHNTKNNILYTMNIYINTIIIYINK